jgi:tetratricopeptide (TPR) repeat protein
LALAGEQQRQVADDLEARAASNAADAATLRAQAGLVREQANDELSRARGDVASAEANAIRVAATGPDRVHFERSLGEAARAIGDTSAAQRHWTAARNAGGGPEVDLLAALIERESGDLPSAIAHLHAVKSHEEVAVRARLALARILAMRGDADGAMAEAEIVVRAQGPNDAGQALKDAVRNRIAPFRATPAQAQAQATAPQAPVVITTPNPAPAPAPAATDSGTTVAATPSPPSNAPASHPRDYDSYVSEGDRLQESGQTTRARAAYMQALELRGDGSEAIAGLAFCESDARNYSVAIAQFRRALQINPHYGVALVGLGEALNHAGDYSGALRAYRDYLSISPNGQYAREAERSVEALEQRLHPDQNSGSGGTGGTTTNSGTGASGESNAAPPTPAPNNDTPSPSDSHPPAGS